MVDNKAKFTRTVSLIGEDRFARLRESRVAVFGLGGVGGYVVEALVRSGVGKMLIFDRDVIDISNINRQIYALDSTLGLRKTDAAAARILDINSDIELESFCMDVNQDALSGMEFKNCNFIVDAVDDVQAKIAIIKKAADCDVPVISCMGTGNKLDPGKLEINKIEKTHTCPLARKMRHELKMASISEVDVLFSTERPVKSAVGPPASIAVVPPAAGLMIASFVINGLTGGFDA